MIFQYDRSKYDMITFVVIQKLKKLLFPYKGSLITFQRVKWLDIKTMMIKHYVPDEPKLFAEIFSRNSDIDKSGILLPVLLSRTNLKLHNISITPRIVKNVITYRDLSRASDSDCIPVAIFFLDYQIFKVLSAVPVLLITWRIVVFFKFPIQFQVLFFNSRDSDSFT